MELNITNILYLLFRLAPFIIVSMFVFSSIFLQDFKAIIYVAGLLLASFIAVCVGKNYNSTSKNQICKTFTISKDGQLSNLPLSQVILNYTFFYLVYIIVSFNLTGQNIPLLLLFPVLILSDILWNWYNECYEIITIISSLIIGSSIGILWSYIITQTNMPSLMYFNGISDAETCSRPSQQTFRCSVYKNGQLISG
jgi:hypothetical protein